MKKIYFIVSIALAGAWILRAQTNTPNTNAAAEILALVTTNAPPPKPTPTNATTQIYSDTFVGDLNSRTAIYSGHVRVDDPRMKLTCAQLTVDLPATGGRINHVVAETNVVIDATDDKGATNHVTCDKAVYDYNVQGMVTNETVTLTGGNPSPKVENSQIIILGDPLVWNLATKQFSGTNFKTIFKPGANSGNGTNGLPFDFLK